MTGRDHTTSGWQGLRQFGALATREIRSTARDLPGRLQAEGRRQRRLERCTTIGDLQRLARRTVPKVVFDFVDGAANDELTLAANQADFRALRLLPRTLVDVSDVSTATTVLGTAVAAPLLGGPTGLTGLVQHEGELGIARAVHAAGSIYVLSAMASYSIEEVRAGTDGPLWFQLYVWRDRGFVSSLIERARAAGCRALVMTVDVPVAGARERDRRNGFGIPPRLTLRSLGQGLSRPRWSRDFLLRPRIEVAHATGQDSVKTGAVSLIEYINTQFDPTLTWTDLQWVRDAWGGSLVVKGILRPDDAVRAVDAGADAIIVSNHGGRQLDGAVSSITALAAVVEAVADRAEIYIDGGVRRGSDVLKALALGARAVFAARPFVYGLAAGGQAGVGRALAILTDELRLSLSLSGVSSISSVPADLVAGAERAAYYP